MLLNDLSTAGNGIIIKQKLESKDFGKNGLMFYNCLFMIIPALIVFYLPEDLNKIKGGRIFSSLLTLIERRQYADKII